MSDPLPAPDLDAEVSRLIRRICYPPVKIAMSSDPPRYRRNLPVTEDSLREVLTELVTALTEASATRPLPAPKQDNPESVAEDMRRKAAHGERWNIPAAQLLAWADAIESQQQDVTLLAQLREVRRILDLNEEDDVVQAVEELLTEASATRQRLEAERPEWIPAVGDYFAVSGRLQTNWKMHGGCVFYCTRVDDYVRVESSFDLGFHPDGWLFIPCEKPREDLTADRLRERALKAEATVARLDAEHRWQTIETAPKDGTKILLWSPPELEAVYAWWQRGDGRPHTPCWTSFGGRIVLYPTHWMPLPDPPPREDQPT